MYDPFERLLDNKQETMFQMMSINYSVDGSSEISIFDAVLTLVIDELAFN